MNVNLLRTTHNVSTSTANAASSEKRTASHRYSEGVTGADLDRDEGRPKAVHSNFDSGSRANPDENWHNSCKSLQNLALADRDPARRVNPKHSATKREKTL